DFVVAWGYGITGRDISVRQSYTKRGQTPQLFPALDDLDGSFLTPEAVEQRREARRFGEYVEALKNALADRIRWRELRNDYRESLAEGKKIALETAAETLRKVFLETLRVWNQSVAPPSLDDVRVIARKALTVQRGRNPNDTAAYELLALYPVVISGRDMK